METVSMALYYQEGVYYMQILTNEEYVNFVIPRHIAKQLDDINGQEIYNDDPNS